MVSREKPLSIFYSILNALLFLTKKLIIYGWVGRIRTYGTRDQNPMPYHLATTQLIN